MERPTDARPADSTCQWCGSTITYVEVDCGDDVVVESA